MQHFFQLLDGHQGAAQLHHFARIDFADRRFAHQAFEVAHVADMRLHFLCKFLIFNKKGDDVVALRDLDQAGQGQQYPFAQQARAHRADGFVEHLEQ